MFYLGQNNCFAHHNLCGVMYYLPLNQQTNLVDSNELFILKFQPPKMNVGHRKIKVTSNVSPKNVHVIYLSAFKIFLFF